MMLRLVDGCNHNGAVDEALSDLVVVVMSPAAAVMRGFCANENGECFAGIGYDVYAPY